MKTMFNCEHCKMQFEDAVKCMEHEKTHPTVGTMRIRSVDYYQSRDSGWPASVWIESPGSSHLYKLV